MQFLLSLLPCLLIPVRIQAITPCRLEHSACDVASSIPYEALQRVLLPYRERSRLLIWNSDTR
jgi:hypothetical protein